MKIKVCGIKSLRDALDAIEAGADLLGFNFYPKSPRYITPMECARIVANLPPKIDTVGVFVNSPIQDILSILDICGLDQAQLSGDEPWSDLEDLNQRAFKAIRFDAMFDSQSELATIPTRKFAPACLVDSNVAGQYGGTGQTADWSAAAELAQKEPILLAGGLTPGNVASAIEQVHPWGVDVASGVESAPGIKDMLKMRAFVKNARRAGQNNDLKVLSSVKDE